MCGRHRCRLGVKLGVAYMPTFIGALVVFYAAILSLRSYHWALDNKAFLHTSVLEVDHFSAWSRGVLLGHVRVDWMAILSTRGIVLSYLVLNLLRVGVSFTPTPRPSSPLTHR